MCVRDSPQVIHAPVDLKITRLMDGPNAFASGVLHFMERTSLNRAVVTVERPADRYAGRRVDLVAVRYGVEHASLVNDGPRGASPITGKRGERYLEAFSPDAFRRTFEQRPGARPARDMHRALIGSATFSDTPGALLATVTINHTPDAENTLEGVVSRAVDSASIGFRPVRHRVVNSVSGPVVLRTEVDLREISLAPSDKALHEGARVLAVRSSATTVAVMPLHERRQRRDADNRRIDEMLERLDDTEDLDAGLITRAEYARKWPTSKLAQLWRRWGDV